jgi:hypothetical protein
MVITILTAGFLLALSLVLFTVGRLRPRKFKIKATLTKWVTLDLEMESPEPSLRLWTARRKKVRSRPHTAEHVGRREGRRVRSLVPRSRKGNEKPASTIIELQSAECGNPEQES